MAYSPDLRKRILDFVQAGGKKAEAARLFNVARSTIDRWLAAKDPYDIKKPGPKKMRVIDEEALRIHVAEFPDATQKERAEHFGVSEFCIGYGLRKLGITRKKKHSGINSAVMRNGQPIATTSLSKKQRANRRFISMNAVFVPRVLELMRMPRRGNLFWGSYQVKEPGKPPC